MKWPQFRLKTIFLVTFIVAVASLAAARQNHLQRQVNRAFVAASRFGARGMATNISGWPWPNASIELDFRGARNLDDTALMSLSDYPIDEIDVSATPVSDGAVKAFQKARPNARIKR